MNDAEHRDKPNSPDEISTHENAEGETPVAASPCCGSIATYIGKNPELSLGIAVAVGVAVGLILKRK